MFDAMSPALLIIDMQNDFVASGAPIRCPGATDICGSIDELRRTARTAGIPVIFTQERHRAEMVDFGLELEYGEPLHCLEGTAGPDFYPALTPEAGEFVVPKRRYSAFFATDLEILLKGLGVDTLILTGVATDVCVRATAQDAQQLNYRVFVVPECVAGTTEARNEAALDNIAYVFGSILPAREACTLLSSTSANPRLSKADRGAPGATRSAA
ncbi:cysteine hydrolase family protein [Mesorhizobium sp. INR15]|uniref:cysteine hydrolase family protein n=1 Tax=Mesorhizobium sp. INR15 TaxID=2654248 RepID=UPI00189663F2|nr:isochorismatase family cysteine hydrolase [Mesorhizobium sp. INR15]QPC94577.1 isochorismatase family protein [Mesorhizobium sp. INR15]